MTNKSDFTSAGTESEKIDVRLSYGIVSLFSEGLYSSPNKAIEELVANSFDAGARQVAVMLPTDFNAQGATIAVLDDGGGMDAEGFKQHWLIGKSQKRAIKELPLDRPQIGKFGIGKLATYVLANRLTHISKKDNKYFATSMDFRIVDKIGEKEVQTKTPIKISLRELSSKEAKEALEKWTGLKGFSKCGIKLFGRSSSKSWTFAILSDLKDKTREIQRGRLKWVLRTVLPLRDDFSIYLDGEKLRASKSEKGLIKKWILGKDILKLQKPAPQNIELNEDKKQTPKSPTRYALQSTALGRITGYAEMYHDKLSGKSDTVGRSHGLFVYVRNRLVNADDGHFGISPNELRHGTFVRIRIVIHMDGLDDYLNSDRERFRESPVLNEAQNILRGIFNFLRNELQTVEDKETPGARLARKFAGSPTSLSRRPIIEMVQAVLESKFESQFIEVPKNLTDSEQRKIVEDLDARAETPDDFVSGIEFVYDATSNACIARYDAQSSSLKVNGMHPFVGAFFDEFYDKKSGLPLEIFVMAEVLLESHLFQSGYSQLQINEVMLTRDQLLRHVANESGQQTSLAISNSLREARNDENKLEIKVVESFEDIGFSATRLGKSGRADGIAIAYLSADEAGVPRRYAVSLEAKSKKFDGKTVSTKTAGISTVARHRDDLKCDHALIVAPAFDHKEGKQSALLTEIEREWANKVDGVTRTITAIHIDDLARLVRLRPIKRLTLGEIRELFISCKTPDECKKWIDVIEKRTVSSPPYAEIIDTIHTLQEKYKKATVKYDGLRIELSHRDPPIEYETDDELINLCQSMSGMATIEITATDQSVELNQSPQNVLKAIERATR